MKKKVLICFIVVLAVIIAGITAWRIVSDYSRVLNANWGFSLPAKAQCAEVYGKDSGESFRGDGIRYHVFSYEYEEYIDSMFAWSLKEKKTLYRSSYSEAANEWLSEIAVPEGYRPDYADCAYWYQAQKDHSEIIVFWDNGKDMLYILESFL